VRRGRGGGERAAVAAQAKRRQQRREESAEPAVNEMKCAGKREEGKRLVSKSHLYSSVNQRI
jgi:hypothetical protein